jgi:hypothetical protein
VPAGSQPECRCEYCPYPSPRCQDPRWFAWNPARPEKGEPGRLGGCQAGCEAPSEARHRDPTPGYRKEGGGGRPGRGGLLGDLNLKGLDAAQMDDLGGVTYEILAAQMEILADNEVSDSGEDTLGGDLEDEVYFSGKGTHNPGASEFKAGARVVYVDQGSDEMHLGYGVAVNVYGEGGAPYYTVTLGGFGAKHTERPKKIHVASQEEPAPPVTFQVPSNSTSKSWSFHAKKDRHAWKEYLKQMSELAKIVQQQCLENKKLIFSTFLSSQREARECPC